MSRSCRRNEKNFHIENTSKSKVDLWLEKCEPPELLSSSSSCNRPPSPRYYQQLPYDKEKTGKIVEDVGKCPEVLGNTEEEPPGEELVENEEEEEEPGEDLEEEEECTAEDLVNVLTSCRVCFESQDTPENSIWCILKHNKYLCLFCFRIVDTDDLVNHSRSERSSSGRCIEGNTFKCPYSECLEVFRKKNDSFIEVHQMFEVLYHHVVKEHLPIAYEREEDEKEEEEVETVRYVSGSVTITTFHEEDVEDSGGDGILREAYQVEDARGNQREPVEQDEGDFEETTVIDVIMGGGSEENTSINMGERFTINGNGSEDSGVEEIRADESHWARNRLKKKKGFEDHLEEPEPEVVCEDDDDDIVILSVTKRKRPLLTSITTAFVCGFCNTAFSLKRRLQDHYERKFCKNLKGKKCKNCQISFGGFSVLQVVKHLTLCDESSQYESKPSISEDVPELREQVQT